MKTESGFRNIANARCRAVPRMTQAPVPHTIVELAIDHPAPVEKMQPDGTTPYEGQGGFVRGASVK
jgi:hypothetical protein